MIYLIANFLINLFGIDFAYAQQIARRIVAAGLIAVLILILLAVIFFSKCGNAPVDPNYAANTNGAKINANVAGNEVNKAANDSNKANANTGAAINSKLSEKSNSFNRANNRYCANFPNDEGCK